MSTDLATYVIHEGRVVLHDGVTLKVRETPSGKYQLVNVKKNTPVESATKTYPTRDEALAALPAAAAAFDAARTRTATAATASTTTEKRVLADAAAAHQQARFDAEDTAERGRDYGATPAQVAYATRLIAQKRRDGDTSGFITFQGGYPTPESLAGMSRRAISTLIDSLTSRY